MPSESISQTYESWISHLQNDIRIRFSTAGYSADHIVISYIIGRADGGDQQTLEEEFFARNKDD